MFSQLGRKTVLLISGLCFAGLNGCFAPAQAGEPEQLSRAQLPGALSQAPSHGQVNPDSQSLDGAATEAVSNPGNKVMTPLVSPARASRYSNPKPVEADLPIKYWGNSFSLKFHRPSCPFAKAMSAHHVMFFNFRKEAVDSGQVPCRYCLPPSWTSVRATLWHSAELQAKTQTP